MTITSTAQAIQRLTEINDVIENFDSVTFDSYQSIKYLKAWPVAETRHFDNGAISTKIKEDDEKMTFKVWMPKNCGLPKHWHDCDEEFTVLSGKIKDLVSNKQVKTGQTMRIKRGMPHQPVNNSWTNCTLLSVIFYKTCGENPGHV